MSAPLHVANGTIAAVTTGSLTVPLPAHEPDDILVAMIMAWVPNTGTSIGVGGTPAGWTVGPNAGLLIAPAGQNDGWLRCQWLRAASSSEADPVFTRGTSPVWDTGNDTCFAGFAVAIRGCTKTGNPFESTARTGVHTAAGGDLPGITVGGAGRLAMVFGIISAASAIGAAPGNWSLVANVSTTTGTDARIVAFRQDDVDADIAAVASNAAAPAAGGYGFWGASFIPDWTPPIPPRSRPYAHLLGR